MNRTELLTAKLIALLTRAAADSTATKFQREVYSDALAQLEERGLLFENNLKECSYELLALPVGNSVAISALVLIAEIRDNII